MTSAAVVLACALGVLGRSPSSMPPIELVDAAPLTGSSGQVEAFVQPPVKVIFLVTSAAVFREAQSARMRCGATNALRKLASILAHEEWHIRYGSDERGAYEAQLTTLLRVGVPPHTALYHTVLRSMLKTLEQQRQQPALVVASSHR